MPNFRRDLIINAAIITCVIGASVVALYYLSRDLKYQSDAIVADRAAISKRAAEIESLADLKKNAAQADVYKQALDKILVSRDQLIDFPRWLDGLARGRGVVPEFSFSGEPVQPQGNNAGYISFALGASGPLGKVVDFMKDVESRAPRFLVRIYSLDLSGNGADYKISSGGRVYFK